MDYEAKDRIMLAGGVYFLPWIGKNYDQGFHSRRLLVLGESHFDEWSGEKHHLSSYFTRECIDDVYSREDGSPFWKTIEQGLLNERRINGWPPSGGPPLWDKLAFYNFVQTPVSGGPRVRPSWEAFQKSQGPFKAVLEQLRPDRVLVCGKGLWNGMEHIPPGEDYIDGDIQAYRLVDGMKVWCPATVHPSSGSYSWSRLHQVIMAFLKEPSEALLVPQNDCSVIS